MKEEKSVAKVQTLEEKAIAMRGEAQHLANQMADFGIRAEDIVVPVILLAQNTSEFVGAGKAKLGDFYHSTEERVIGSLSQPLKFIPLRAFTNVRVYDISGGAPKFLRVDDMPVAGKVEKEGREGELLVKKYVTMNFYALLVSEIDKDEATPVLLRFKSTGTPAGRSIASHVFKLFTLNRAPYSQVLELTATTQKKEKNTYAVFGVSAKGEKANAKALEAAECWLPRLAALKLHEPVEDSLDEEAPVPTVAPSIVTTGTVVGSEEGPY